MDQFSHDLAVALEETSLLNRARVSWGQRRRTRSTGNLPSAPQPTEDSSSSPTDACGAVVRPLHAANKNPDGLDAQSALLALSDSDEKDELLVRFPCKPFNTTKTAIQRLATLESDSLNETFSPARFFKPSTRRKRKLKRMSVEYDVAAASAPTAGASADMAASSAGYIMMETTSASAPTNATLRKRGLKTDVSAHRAGNLFFCGKRKRSNRDRYQEHGDMSFGLHSTSMPRNNNWDEYRGMRPRSFSSTSAPLAERCLLPLNKGLISKIERIAQAQKTNNKTILETTIATTTAITAALSTPIATTTTTLPITLMPISTTSITPTTLLESEIIEQLKQLPLTKALAPSLESKVGRNMTKTAHTKQSQRVGGSRRSRHQLQQQLQFAVDQYSMDCSELNDLSSSSSLSSSDSDDERTANGTDREGDDELTDWPGNNEFGGGGGGAGNMALDFKRKLTKKSQLPQIRSDDMDGESTIISGIEWSSEVLDAEAHHDALEIRYQPSDPITIGQRGFGFGGNTSFGSGSGSRAGLSETGLSGGAELSSHEHDMSIIPPIKQIESEMSGETSTNFLSSPPCPVPEVREIRAGCRRVKGERPGFSIKTSVNERLARFLQEPRLTQIRLPDIEIYEQESLINLATLYSLQMTQDNGCVVLTKTSKTTQSANMEQQTLQGHLFLSDFKRRCYDSQTNNVVPPNA